VVLATGWPLLPPSLDPTLLFPMLLFLLDDAALLKLDRFVNGGGGSVEEGWWN
jgi:hypothetical protein